jgi:tetratricopeptide (TPR) repeat protein
MNRAASDLCVDVDLLPYRRVPAHKPEAAPLRPPAAIASGQWTPLLAVAVLALVVRLVYLWQVSQAPFFHLRLGDAAAYHDWALRIVGGNWRGDSVFYQAPLYPYFLAGVYALFGDGAAMVRFIQAIIGSLSCVLLAAAGMALFGRRGVVAGVLLAIYPAAIFLDGLFDKTTLVSFFTVTLLYLLAARHVRLREFFAGMVLGVLALTRENALLLVLPVLLWFLIAERHSRPALTAAAFLAGCALVLLPVGARNYVVGGEFHLTTSQFGPNFYIGNHAGARGLYEPLVTGHGSVADERADATRLAEEASGRTLSPDEVSSFWTGKAFEFIRAQPGAWTGQLARKLALTYNAVEIADTESQEVYAEWSSLLRALRPLSFGIVLGLAAFGACMTAGQWPRLWFLHAIVLTYTLSIVIFYVFARYRFPLVPVLILVAAGGMAGWPDKSARPMRRWALGAFALAAGLAYLPLEDTRADRVAHNVNIANAFLEDSGKWDQASIFYGRALAESPRSPAAHFGLGTLLTQRRQHREALGHYQTAVAGWPDNKDLRLNLAVALAAVGENQGALEQLDAAASLGAADPTAYTVAGNLLLTMGRFVEAKQKFEQALAVNPSAPGAREGLQKANSLRGEKAAALQPPG